MVFRATRQRNTLVDFKWNKVYRADNGQPGGSNQCTGRSGQHLEMPVPVGTTISDAESGELIADLDEEGAEYRVPGGRGGLGNMHFKSSTNRTPRKATPGKPGVETFATALSAADDVFAALAGYERDG